jgi:methionine biosynthesis protein MetW
MRPDHQLIADLIPKDSSALDLGCGDGSLLEILRSKGIRCQGIDIESDKIMDCIRKGITVVHGDLDAGLKSYRTRCMDYVILNRTIQVVHKPILVMEEMLRVGNYAIVGFPNFAHWEIRKDLLLKGRMPKSKSLPYEWYNTPNIHLLTINDFEDICVNNGYRIVKRIYYRPHKKSFFLVKLWPNLLATHAIYLLTKTR